MGNVQEKVRGFKGFLGDVSTEMKKCSWPGRSELVESTMVVIISMILLSLFVGVSDWVLVKLLSWLIPTG